MKSAEAVSPTSLKALGWYLAEMMVNGAATRSVPVVPSSVYPSGLAFSTINALIEPAAPGMFSVIRGCPKRRCNMALAVRIETSAGPPAGNAIFTLIGRVG